MNPNDTLAEQTPLVRELLLTRLKVAARTSLPTSAAASLDTRLSVERALNRLLIEIRSQVLATAQEHHQLTETIPVEFHAPATWWQHWKHAHRNSRGCRWWIRRRPPRMAAHTRTARAHIDFTTWTGFPHATVDFPPELGDPVRYVQTQPANWSLEGQ